MYITESMHWKLPMKHSTFKKSTDKVASRPKLCTNASTRERADNSIREIVKFWTRFNLILFLSFSAWILWGKHLLAAYYLKLFEVVSIEMCEQIPDFKPWGFSHTRVYKLSTRQQVSYRDIPTFLMIIILNIITQRTHGSTPWNISLQIFKKLNTLLKY
jgi:hypothetical protein